MHILGLCGSLRTDSLNRRLLEVAGRSLPDGSSLEISSLVGELPLFDEDLEVGPLPGSVRTFHRAIREADAVLIASPEYNGSLTGPLKNAIDWASRPPGDSTLEGKPVAIMGATPGMWGTARAQMQLRQALIYNNCPMVLQPEVLVAKAGDRFDDDGNLTHGSTRDFVRKLLQELVDLVER
jgi:chromate reductase, NAD(P)H dehydrogenase (quinone)